MRISNILIEDKIKEKILWKHGVRASELKDIFSTNPYLIKIDKEVYMAVGYIERHLTIIFKLVKDTVYIVTAYPSTDAQRKLYKSKRR